jgi:hypothetical protein
MPELSKAAREAMEAALGASDKPSASGRFQDGWLAARDYYRSDVSLGLPDGELLYRCASCGALMSACGTPECGLCGAEMEPVEWPLSSQRERALREALDNLGEAIERVESKPVGMSYIGVLPCGCITAAMIDRDLTKRELRGFYRDMADTGREVRRMPTDEVRHHPLFLVDCPHGDAT